MNEDKWTEMDWFYEHCLKPDLNKKEDVESPVTIAKLKCENANLKNKIAELEWKLAQIKGVVNDS